MYKSKLINNYIPEILRLMFGRKIPSNVSVNLTDKCNQRCIYCEIGNSCAYQEGNLLTKDDLFWIIDQMAKSRMKKLSMCGGEPFLFTDIIDVVSYAWQNNITCNITSNGMNIHSLSDNELRILKNCNAIINISVDSFNEDIQIKTRGMESALSNALKSIKKLSENGIQVIILTVISKYNYTDLYKSLICAYEHGINQILYQPVIKYSNYPDRIVINNKTDLNVPSYKLDVLYDELKKIYSFERKHKIKTNVFRLLPWIKEYIGFVPDSNTKFFFNNMLKKFYCREVSAVIDINYYGGIQPCGLMIAEKSIKENKTADLLLQWEKANEKLKFDLKNRNYPNCCNGCCHKFGRNMLASAFKKPFANRKFFIKILILIADRIISITFKKLFIRGNESYSGYRC
jgi:MoaA/NifB/PqqE/SkfB family radical SAM enzyme